MGRWLALLRDESARTPSAPTDKTPTTAPDRVLQVLSVPREEASANAAGAAVDVEAFEERAVILEFDARLPRDEAERQARVMLTRPDPLALQQARRDRLLRWGWPAAEAAAMADRLTQRDRQHDERVSCTECQHYSPGRCGNHRRADLRTAEVGRELAGLLQRCPGFQPSR